MESTLTSEAAPVQARPKVASNQALYDLRLSHDLKLHEAAHAMGITTLGLYLAERGYVRLSKRLKKGAIAFYQCDPALFEDELLYPTPIENTTVKKPSKLLTFAFSWRGVLVCAIASVLAWGAFGTGYGLAIYSRENVESYYASAYFEFCGAVEAKGEASEDGLEYTYTYDAGNDESLDVLMSIDSHLVGQMKFTYSFTSDDDHDISLSYQQKNSTLSFSFSDIKLSLSEFSDSALAIGSGLIVDGVYQAKKILFGASLVEQDSAEYFADLDARIAPHVKAVEGYFVELGKALGYTGGLSFYQLLSLQGEGYAKQSVPSVIGDNLILYGSLLGASFVFGVAFCALMAIGLKKKKKVPVLQDSAIPTSGFEEVKPLKKNWAFAPFLPESVLRFACISLLLTASIILFRLVYSIFHLGMVDLNFVQEIIGESKDFMRIQNYVVVATLLWFFIRIEIMARQGNAIVTAVMFGFFGVLYYIGMDTLNFYLTDMNDTYRSLLLTVLTLILPGNVFWGLGAFSLIVLFLGTIPEGYSKGKKILWHSLAIFPIAYLLVSYFYAVGTKLWGWTSWPSWAENLLFRKQFAATVFAIVYPFMTTLHRYLIRKKYGKEQAEIYFQGNLYYFTRNLFACLIIAAIALIVNFMKASPLASALDLKKAAWCWLLIPLILFYHPHVGKRSQLWDLMFAVLYLGSMMVGYGYLAYRVLFLF